MMSRSFFIAFVLVFAGVSTNATAQVNDPVQEWANNLNLSIRKAFDGTKSEQSPASILWLVDLVGDDREYSVIDFAAKVSEWDLRPHSPRTLFVIYPVAEYHRQTQETKRVNNASLGLKAELQPVPARSAPPSGQAPPFPGAGSGWVVAPLFVLDGKLGRDWQAKSTNQRYSALLTFLSNRRWLPGGDLRDSDDVLRARYYPYVGLEHFRTSIDDADKSATFGVGRFYLEMWPVTTLTSKYLQLVGEATYRSHFSGPLRERDAKEYSASANLFVDGRGHFGIGLEYVRGEDPNETFKFRERVSIALKILL